MPHTPILWSFRRCPYAIRARLAVLAAGVQVDLRDILLKDKPQAFLDTSPKATVPVLDTGTDVIAESRDIMLWALNLRDPDGWLDMPAEGFALIDRNDGPFKQALDHTKYAVRYPDRDTQADRSRAAAVVHDLDARLAGRAYLFGDRPTCADAALLPFIRQFANIDRSWFDAQDWPQVIRWLTAFEVSDSFRTIMIKRPLWAPGAAPHLFP